MVNHGLSTAFVAGQFSVSRRRVQQLVKEYRETGEMPVLTRPGRRSYAAYPVDLRGEILRAREKLRCGAVGIGNYLRRVRGFKVANNVDPPGLAGGGNGEGGAEQ